MSLSDLLRNGDQFEFIPGIESKVLYIRRHGQTSSLKIQEVGMHFSHRFKLYYDRVNDRYTAATIPQGKSKRKKIYGPDVDLTLMAFKKWEKQNGM